MTIQTQPEGYIARLDKATGLRVLCGYPTCSGQLGKVIEFYRGQVRELVMEPGWQVDENGVWARIRWLDGRERAGYGSDSRARRGQVRNSIDAVTGRRDRTPRQHGLYVHTFPAKAVCPRCKHVNTLLADRLRVETEAEYEARLMAAYEAHPPGNSA